MLPVTCWSSIIDLQPVIAVGVCGISKTEYEENLESRAQLFMALGYPVRLLILNLVKTKPRHGEELAAILNLNAATISHHLSQLTSVGLRRSQKDQYYQVYSLTGEILLKSLDDIVGLPQAGLTAAVAEDAYRQKVVRRYFKHGRLDHLPAQLKKWQIILERIVEEFEPGRGYTEQEVNLALLEFNDDVATLRRGLIDLKLMVRERDLYQRPVA
jgi:biotin operon repressor